MTSMYEVLMPLAPWERPDIVAEAIASLHAQTLSPRRVVISCDGEPAHDLGQILDPLIGAQDIPYVFVVGPGGEGVGPVLARGLLACQTDLVLRADADDISWPDRARRQVEAMVQRPELAALSCQIHEFLHHPEQSRRTRTVPVGPVAVGRYLRWRNPMNHPAVILRRSSVIAAGNYKDCPNFEDYHLWLRLYQRGESLDNLDAPLVSARVGTAHLIRRSGIGYARREASFFFLCGRQGLLPWHHAILLVLLRCPSRLLPIAVFRAFFHYFLRTNAKG